MVIRFQQRLKLRPQLQFKGKPVRPCACIACMCVCACVRLCAFKCTCGSVALRSRGLPRAFPFAVRSIVRSLVRSCLPGVRACAPVPLCIGVAAPSCQGEQMSSNIYVKAVKTTTRVKTMCPDENVSRQKIVRTNECQTTECPDKHVSRRTRVEIQCVNTTA